MSFTSKHAYTIWNKLYTVLIPDVLTLSPEYIKRRGVFITENKEVNKMLLTNKTTVMIPIIKILEYFIDGIEVEIPSRPDMITMHKEIELYLEEWKQHLYFDINTDVEKHRELIASLEKLSKYIYERARPVEVIPPSISIGIQSSYAQVKHEQQFSNKPDYEGISQFLKNMRPRERF